MTDPIFDEDYFTRLAQAGEHWWVRGMLDVGASILGEVGGPLSILDAGSGTGRNLEWLAELAGPGKVVAVDLATAAFAYGGRHGPATDVVQASVSQLPFADAVFDLVVTTDVLQHLTQEDEQRALGNMRRVLRPGGRLLARTNSSFGRGEVRQREDWRLYTTEGLRRALENAGFTVERLTPVNSLQGLWASLPRPRPTSDRLGKKPERHTGLGIPRPVPRWKNQTLLGLLRAEARWLARPGRRLPVGHSLYALARRPAVTQDGSTITSTTIPNSEPE